MPRFAHAWLVCLSLLVPLELSGSKATAQLPLEIVDPNDDRAIDFHRDIQPLLQRNCVACHQAQEAEGGLVLESHQTLLAGGDSGPAVVPKEPDASLLLARASGREEPLMPPEDNDVGAQPLTPQQLGLLRRWIAQGALAGEASPANAIHWQPVPSQLQPIYALATSADGRFAASGRGNEVAIYDLRRGLPVTQLIDRDLPTEFRAAADRDLIQSIDFAPAGRVVATGGYRTVKLWHPSDPVVSNGAPSLSAAVGRVAASADGARLAVVNAVDDVEIWDATANQRLHTLPGRGASIVGLTWTADGDTVISADADGRIAHCDATTGSLRSETATALVLRHFAASSDGHWLALVDSGKRASLWRAATHDDRGDDGTAQPAFTAVTQPMIEAIADATAVLILEGPQPRLVVATETGDASIFDLQQDKPLFQVQHGAAITALAVSSDRATIATAGRDGNVRLWAASDGKEIITCGPDASRDVAIVTAQRDADRQQANVNRMTERKAELEKRAASEVEARDAAQAKRDQAAKALAEAQQQSDAAAADLAAAEAALAAAKAESETIGTVQDGDSEAVEVAADNASDTTKQAADGPAAERLKQLTADLEQLRKAATEAEQTRRANAAALEQQEQALKTAAQVAERSAADVVDHEASLQQAQRWAAELAQRLAVQLEQHKASRSPVTAVALKGNSGQLAAAHADGQVRLFDSNDGTLLDMFHGVSGRIDGLMFLGDQTLCAFGRQAAPTVWSLAPTWELRQTIGSVDESPLSDRVTAIDFRPDGRSIAVGGGPPSGFGEVLLLAGHSGLPLRDLGHLHSDSVLSVQFSPDGRTLACSAADNTIRLVDVGTGNVLRVLEGHTHHVLAVAWQDDGQTLASASADLTVKLWEPASGQQQRTLTDFPKEVTAVAFVGTTSQLVSACADGQLRIHDAASGKLLRTFGTGSDYLYALHVTADGNTILSGGQEGVVRAWNASDGKLLRELR